MHSGTWTGQRMYLSSTCFVDGDSFSKRLKLDSAKKASMALKSAESEPKTVHGSEALLHLLSQKEWDPWRYA